MDLDWYTGVGCLRTEYCISGGSNSVERTLGVWRHVSRMERGEPGGRGKRGKWSTEQWQPMLGLLASYKVFGFYSKYNGESLKDFEHWCDPNRVDHFLLCQVPLVVSHYLTICVIIYFLTCSIRQCISLTILFSLSSLAVSTISGTE